MFKLQELYAIHIYSYVKPDVDIKIQRNETEGQGNQMA